MKDTKPTICIVNGVARSGTTFLAAVINSLPQSFFFTNVFNLPKYYQDMHGILDYPFSLSEYRRANHVDFGKRIPNFASFEVQCVNETLSLLKDPPREEKIKDKLRERAGQESNLSYVRAFELFYETLSEEFNAPIVGGKITFGHSYRNQMLINIPNLKWIDIVRDVRAVMCSGLAINMYDVNKLALYEPWKEHLDTLINCKKNFLEEPSKRHLVVRYRDLILEKETTVFKIVEFLGIEGFDYNLWAKKRIVKNDGSDFGSHSSFDQNGQPRPTNDFMDGIKAFDETPVDRWKTQLSKSQKWLLTTLYRRELEFLKFETTSSQVIVKPQYLWLNLKINLGRMARFFIKALKKYF